MSLRHFTFLSVELFVPIKTGVMRDNVLKQPEYLEQFMSACGLGVESFAFDEEVLEYD